MMFLAMIPEDLWTPPKRKARVPPITESNYFENDVAKLSMFRCPCCKEYLLFRGVVYIGCVGCFEYWSEQDIIKENIGE